MNYYSEINQNALGHVPSASSKALRINLDPNIYGTFAEIGAGQETVRHFFRVGGASGTIAKAISAYDKHFSDRLYGVEKDGRYVTENRLKRMLDREMMLVEERLSRDENPNKCFFTYANTIATIDFAKRYKGHGWVGLRFQTSPTKLCNDILLHVRFHQTEARLQQETLGVLGVNLIYGAFYKYTDPKKILIDLYDNIDKDALEIDTINFSGPDFEHVDNRLMSLELVKNNMTEAVMFNPEGQNVLPAAQLYKKNILALRGSFRPVTKVNMAMYKSSFGMFLSEENVSTVNTEVIFEITLSNLKFEGDIDEQDFLDRADLLCSLGQTVLISNFKEYYRVVEFFSNYTKEKIVLAMGVNNLVEIFDENYYNHLSGGILEAFGKLFHKGTLIYLYPMKDPETGEIINSDNVKVNNRSKELYKFFKFTQRITDIKDYSPAVLDIFSRDVLKRIGSGQQGWEAMLPDGIANLIKTKKLFGYKSKG